MAVNNAVVLNADFGGVHEDRVDSLKDGTPVSPLSTSTTEASTETLVSTISSVDTDLSLCHDGDLHRRTAGSKVHLLPFQHAVGPNSAVCPFSLAVGAASLPSNAEDHTTGQRVSALMYADDIVTSTTSRQIAELSQHEHRFEEHKNHTEATQTDGLNESNKLRRDSKIDSLLEINIDEGFTADSHMTRGQHVVKLELESSDDLTLTEHGDDQVQSDRNMLLPTSRVVARHDACSHKRGEQDFEDSSCASDLTDEEPPPGTVFPRPSDDLANDDADTPGEHELIPNLDLLDRGNRPSLAKLRPDFSSVHSSDSSSSSDCDSTIMSDSSSDSSSMLDSLSSADSSCSSSSSDHSRKADIKARRVFQFREKTLRRLSKKSTKGHLDFLRGNESAVRSRWERLLGTETEAVENRNLRRSRNGVMETCTHMLRRHYLFERYHSVPGLLTYTLNAFTHVAIYEFMNIVMQEATIDYDSQVTVYTILMLAMLLLARFSGGLWEWLSDDTYDCAKFDMHNKYRLGDWDARALRWLKKRPNLVCFLDVLSFSGLLLVANYFLTIHIPNALFDIKEDVIEELPSMKYPDVSTHIKTMLTVGEDIFEDAKYAGPAYRGLAGMQCAWHDCESDILTICNSLEELRSDLTAEDGRYLESRLSFDTYFKLIGEPDAPVVDHYLLSFLFLAVSVVGIYTLSKVGIGIWSR